MRDTIFSGIGSLLSVMASHVRRCSKLGADAPPHFSRISIFFDHRQSPLATQPRWARSLDLAGQDDPGKNLPGSELPPPRAPPTAPTPGRASLSAPASLQGCVQIPVKSGFMLPTIRTRAINPQGFSRPKVSVYITYS